MIVTVTLNTALGVRYQARDVDWDATNQVSGVRYQAAGRGVAVARLLHTFGHEVIAAGLAGGSAGEMIRADLARSGIPADFTAIGRESRRLLEVRDGANGRRLRFSEPGPYITTEELGRFAADYRRWLAGATAVVLCGSLPAGMPPEIYATLATYADDAGVPVVLDAGGPALQHAAARRPALMIPDPGGLPGDPDVLSEPGARALVAAGAGAVALLTGDAVRAVTAAGQWQATLPARNGPCWPRDVLVAGLVPGVLLGWSWQDRLRHAVALGASASAEGEVDLAAYERLVGEVRVDPPG